MKMNQKRLSLFLVITFIFTCFNLGLVTYAEDDGLVAHYTFDGNVNDVSGSGNNGTVAGLGITYVDAVVGQGAVFNGKGWIEVNDNNSLDLTNEFTFSAWVYSDSHNEQAPIFSKGNTNSDGNESPYAFGKINYGAKPFVRLVDEENDYREYIESESYADIQKWQLLTATWDGNNVTFFIDGERQDSFTFDKVLSNSNNKLLIGKDMMENIMFTGILDDLRIYSTVLDDMEINNLYVDGSESSSHISFQKKLVAYYPFDSNATDISGLINNGTAMGTGHSYVNSVKGKGIKLDGKSWVEVADSDSLDLNKEFTFSAWVYRDVTGEEQEVQPIFTKGDTNDSGNSSPYAFLSDGDYPSARLVNTSNDYREYIETNTKTDIQKWQFITVNYDGQNVTFFVDGIRNSSVTWQGPIAHSKSKLLIGKDLMENVFFKGIIDELRIHNYCLTDSQIQTIFNESIEGTTIIGLQKKLVARYQFEGDFKDSSGLNNDGKSINGVSFIQAMQGKGAMFNGRNFIEINDNDSLDVDKAFTFSAWVYKDDAKNSTLPIFAKCDTNSNGRNSPYALVLDYGKPSVRVTDFVNDYRTYNTSEYTLKNKEPHLITAKWDSQSGGSNVTYYVDGVRKTSTTWEGIVAHSGSKLIIGRDLMDGTTYFKGVLDDVRIYNYALSDTQIKDLYKKDTFTITGPGKTLKVKKSYQSKALLKSVGSSSSKNVTKYVKYTSSNKNATVTSSGKIVAKKKGSVTITATYGIRTASVSFKVI